VNAAEAPAWATGSATRAWEAALLHPGIAALRNGFLRKHLYDGASDHDRMK